MNQRWHHRADLTIMPRHIEIIFLVLMILPVKKYVMAVLAIPQQLE